MKVFVIDPTWKTVPAVAGCFVARSTDPKPLAHSRSRAVADRNRHPEAVQGRHFVPDNSSDSGWRWRVQVRCHPGASSETDG